VNGTAEAQTRATGAQTSAAAKPTARPIVFAVRDIPIEAFGGEHGRQTRKFLLLTLATHADQDGTRCYPGVGTIARETGLSQRGARKVITWLREHGFLGIAYKASGLQTNVFTVMIPEGVRNSIVPEELQRSSGTESTEVGNPSVPGGEERRARGAERQRSYNLPITNQLPTKTPTKARKSTALEKFDLPSWVPLKEWKDYEEMRKAKRKPMTARAAELVVLELDKSRAAGDSPAEVLNRSIANSWTDVYPLKRDGGYGKQPTRKLSDIDYAKSYGLPEGESIGRL
jgi:Helix-turn-helix domain